MKHFISFMLILFINICTGKEINFKKGGVNCGNHIAPKCEDCILDIGPDGCLDNGDCFLNKTTSTCTKKGNGKCENLEPWCDAAKPNCQESFVREKCQKYCGLCQDFSNCENKENWCEAAQPNCNTDVAKDGCQRYCGICKSNSCGLNTCNNSQKCCKYQKCEDLNSNDIPDPRTWTCEENCPINPVYCSQNNGETTEKPEGKTTTTRKPTPQSLEILRLKTEVGKDGTEDDMSIKICSDVDRKQCCGGGLSKGSNEEFSKNQIENWDADEIGGNCENEELEILNVPRISVTKVGTDNFEMREVNLFMNTRSGNEIRISCGGFKLLGACTGRGCTFTYENCKNCELESC